VARLEVRHERGRFRNPIVLASGPAGFGLELADGLDFRAVGALTTKTVTLEPRDGNPQPRLVDAPAGALNSIGLENPGLAAFRSEILPRIRDLPVPRIVSLAGRTPEEVARAAAELDGEAGVDWLELNLSCPNVQGETVADHPDRVTAYVGAARTATRLPILAKLPPSDNHLALGKAALEAGADGLTLINSVRGLRIHADSGRPFLARECGGLSGPAILPLALARVFEARRAFPDAFLVGTGGVDCVRSVVEMLCAGASAVGVGLAVMSDPGAVFGLAAGLERWLEARGIGGVEDLMSAAHRGGIRVS
jgi:dihydroorotate dehydrogenase (NAD+) catalytic subunit